MSKLPILKPQKLIKILQQLGFVKIRQEGSQGKDIGRGLLRAIISDINLTSQEFQKYL